MHQPVEIVFHVEIDSDRQADLPVLLRGTLDAWAAVGMIGDVAVWAVYETNYYPQAVLPLAGL
jgi:hypothetical protein